MAGAPDTMKVTTSQVSQGSCQDTETQGHKRTDSETSISKAVRNAGREEFQQCQTSQRAVDAHEQSTEVVNAYCSCYQKEHQKVKELQAILRDKDKELQRKNEENKELQKLFTEARVNLASLKKLMVLAGRKEPKPLDDDIITKFVTLKSDIFQMVRAHLNNTRKAKGVWEENTAPELPELIIRSRIATLLWSHFFDPKVLLFGLDDDRRDNTLRKLENSIIRTRQQTDDLTEWRNSTIQIIKSMKSTIQNQYHLECASQIWERMEEFCHYDEKNVSDRRQAKKDLEDICNTAYDAAILFRETKMEYEWEQNYDILPSRKPNADDHEIAGILKPDPSKTHEIDCVVFGGVIRGDRKTGRLSDSRKRLTQTTVIIIASSSSPERFR